ncbi:MULTISPECIES: hypothetical protein [unclassified Beijerinckia]|uniref:hypothetical protein n=1 Tax=unclassified Beijerinckia TaxID=2638183 RepID=UPI00089B1222|nr:MULTISPECIES: hypothetical protein [unclassified Beijerinckia]MDH7794695.1 hypothetical protein [Beijerinckia sp. GAS462]SEB71686.1 hypothetical protein SAMN05443249_0969 [Beijerinckia sp. 28-YEA-48]
MNDRIARLVHLSQRLTQAEENFAVEAEAVRTAATRLAEGQGDARLAGVMDDLFKHMRARARLDDGQLLAETSLLLRRRGGPSGTNPVSEAA